MGQEVVDIRTMMKKSERGWALTTKVEASNGGQTDWAAATWLWLVQSAVLFQTRWVASQVQKFVSLNCSQSPLLWWDKEKQEEEDRDTVTEWQSCCVTDCRCSCCSGNRMWNSLVRTTARGRKRENLRLSPSTAVQQLLHPECPVSSAADRAAGTSTSVNWRKDHVSVTQRLCLLCPDSQDIKGQFRLVVSQWTVGWRDQQYPCCPLCGLTYND